MAAGRRRPLTQRLALATSGREPVGHAIADAAQAGYDAVELPIASGTRVDGVAAALATSGIACWGGVAASSSKVDPASGDRGVRERTIAYLKEALSLVATLGGSVLVVVPAAVEVEVPLDGRERAWRRAAETLRACSDRAAADSIRLAIEPLNRYESSLVNRCDQALQLAEEVGPECGVCLDLFHMNIEEPDWEAAVRSASSRLADVHVAENTRRAPGASGRDWTQLRDVLDEIRYPGFVTVEYDLATEFAAPDGRPPIAAYGDAARVLRTAFARV